MIVILIASLFALGECGGWGSSPHVVHDREQHLLHPCAVHDDQCIRSYLAQNSKCRPQHGYVRDDSYTEKSPSYFPFADINAVSTQLTVTGLKSIHISEFYVSKNTGNLVMAFSFARLNHTTPKIYFTYLRPAAEPIELQDEGTVAYSGMFTVVIPRVPHLRLDEADIHLSLNPHTVTYYFGPGSYKSYDPTVISSFTKLTSNIPTLIKDLHQSRNNNLIISYIQENICDFGLKI